ncbi:hypothetical protein M5689_017682 [Euphorbia peplus]|nr:hypothetical protein M5689_017682 [Euphorbia peplus]
MTKGYKILRKKLQEVETLLKKVLFLPPETPQHEQDAEDIEQRLDFLNNLFTAEVSSNPENAHHLKHIGKKLVLLENVFKQWNEFRTTPDNKSLDTVSACSCNESCFNDDEVEGEEFLEEEEKKEEIKEVRVCGCGRTRLAMTLGFGLGVLIGMGTSVLSIVGLSLSHSSHIFLTPT